MSRIEDDEQNISAADGFEDEEDEDGCEEAEDGEAKPGELWDLMRPLIGDCELRLLKFDDKEAKVGGCATPFVSST